MYTGGLVAAGEEHPSGSYYPVQNQIMDALSIWIQLRGEMLDSIYVSEFSSFQILAHGCSS